MVRVFHAATKEDISMNSLEGYSYNIGLYCKGNYMGYLYLKFAYVYSCGAPFDSNVQVLTQMQGWVGLVIAQPRLRKTQGFGFRGVSTLNPKP